MKKFMLVSTLMMGGMCSASGSEMLNAPCLPNTVKIADAVEVTCVQNAPKNAAAAIVKVADKFGMGRCSGQMAIAC